MHNKGTVIAISVLAALVFTVLVINLMSLSMPKQTAVTAAVSDEEVNSVTVYGQGKIAVTPDMATITFGYENSDKDAKAAQDTNKAQMDKIMDAVKRAGVSEGQMHTASYGVYRDNSRSLFTVSNMIQVQIEDIERTSNIIQAASVAGANQFWDVRFDIVILNYTLG